MAVMNALSHDGRLTEKCDTSRVRTAITSLFARSAQREGLRLLTLTMRS